MNKKLYTHTTDGGAEYLCAAPVPGTNEGAMNSTVIRLDGQPEFTNPVYAAAPELLEALQNLMKQAVKDAEEYAPEGNESIWAFISDASDAITKATRG